MTNHAPYDGQGSDEPSVGRPIITKSAIRLASRVMPVGRSNTGRAGSDS